MKEKKTVKNILFSMKTAIILLLILTAACIVGSVIPQGEIEAYYLGYYPEKIGRLMLFCGFDDVFHSLWFIILTICLCLNLSGCNLIHFPLLMRRMKTGFSAEKHFKAFNGQGDVTVDVSSVTELFKRLHFTHVEEGTVDGKKTWYAVRNKIGIWGAWLTHLGMLVIIIGFSLGQTFMVKYTVYGVPGETLAVEGTDYSVTINDFNTILREDETVEQYVSNLTLTKGQESISGETSVNHPMKAMGMKLYQNSTGWAAKVLIFKGEELLQSELLCAGEHLAFKDLPDLVLAFNAFYPDYVNDGGNPATASSKLNHPAYLYTLYYQGNVLGMNVLMEKEKITVEDYSVIFMDPEQYTLIQLKRDPYTGIAMIGGLLILLALFLSFYVRTEELFGMEKEDGSVSITGFSKKGGVLFHDRILEEASSLKKS